jgi:hypothetical protein
MKSKSFLSVVIVSVLFNSCVNSQTDVNTSSVHNETKDILIPIDSSGMTIETRFNVPTAFKRAEVAENGFADFLRKLPLKETGSSVSYYDGGQKSNYGVYAAVVDLSIGNKDLHQCADAIIRLRADYLRSKKHYDSIRFHFTNGFMADYPNWLKGKSIVVNGNSVQWSAAAAARQDSDENYWRYLEKVFTYAGTLSLSKELKPKSIDEIGIGDVFIKGGSPGHAVIVVDMSVHKETGEKRFLLAQSYMPAQEIQILENPGNSDLSPWYTIPKDGILKTPEWTFTVDQLKSF